MQKKMLKKQKNEKLPTIDEKEVLTISKAGQLLLNGVLMTEQEINSVKAEVAFLLNTKIWNIFQETLKKKAYEVMFEKSESFDDMKSGKMMLFNLSIQKNIADIFDKYKSKK